MTIRINIGGLEFWKNHLSHDNNTKDDGHSTMLTNRNNDIDFDKNQSAHNAKDNRHPTSTISLNLTIMIRVSGTAPFSSSATLFPPCIPFFAAKFKVVLSWTHDHKSTLHKIVEPPRLPRLTFRPHRHLFVFTTIFYYRFG